ncbi:AAA family ATPase [Proteiniclasticum ruminis]|uniref:AAA family ATPase n=1 Tax=Proteiniclasticum ruminis TaxID=398199 RepID=UPI0028B003EF|nr:AAA family ATPase [Proteiniclasticum ruminis]
MAKIEGIRIKNFRALKDITIGKLWNTSTKPITPLTAVIGKNGVGKSTIFDAFGFLADCMRYDVEEACDMRGRGGFNRIRSMGVSDPIEFEIYYKENPKSRPITYEIAIDLDRSERPFVLRERLRQRRVGQKHGRPFSFLVLNEGKGLVWKGDFAGISLDDNLEIIDIFAFIDSQDAQNIAESAETERVELNNRRKLGISTLGSLKQHPRISKFREFIEGWYVSYFTPNASRSLPLAGPHRHLNSEGDNLGNYVQYLEREHKDRFKRILNSISNKIPGIEKIDTMKTPDGRLLLRFNDRGFNDPFYAQQVSDGTLKTFAYLLLLEDPSPAPFLCIEEPENGLYHRLLEILVEEFRNHTKSTKGSQIFVTTHQPYFVDALKPEEVWILEKGIDGFSNIRRASEIDLVRNLVDEGLLLGSLWYSDYLDEVKNNAL